MRSSVYIIFVCNIIMGADWYREVRELPLTGVFQHFSTLFNIPGTSLHTACDDVEKRFSTFFSHKSNIQRPFSR